jgi:hypothetical protein
MKELIIRPIGYKRKSRSYHRAPSRKGGRNFRFSCLVVVGDGNGHVGAGLGKAIEIPEAIRKGIEDAKKNMITVPMKGTTIPHQIIGRFGAGKMLLMPAGEGTALCGRPARAVLELAAFRHQTKSLAPQCQHMGRLRLRTFSTYRPSSSLPSATRLLKRYWVRFVRKIG